MPKPLRILHLITGLNTGGAELALARLLEVMNQQDFESCVVSMISLGPVGNQIQSKGFAVFSLDMPPGRASFAGFVKLTRIIRNFQPQILQTWMYHADLLGLIAGKMLRIPAIAWNIRGSESNFMSSKRMSKIVANICAILSGWPQAVIVNSRAGLSAHENLGYSPRKWCFIPNGIDTIRFSPDPSAGKSLRTQWNIPENVDIIGMVARIDPQKGYHDFLQAASLVNDKKINVFFVCVGGGAPEFVSELKKQATKLGIEDKVLWTGPLFDMPAVYNTFSLCVSASAYGEGFPNVVAEAMSCGIPCVVTKTGDSPDLIADAGLVVAPRDPEAMADAICQILDASDQERKRLGTLARRRIIENFSLDKMVQQYTNLYNQLS